MSYYKDSIAARFGQYLVYGGLALLVLALLVPREYLASVLAGFSAAAIVVGALLWLVPLGFERRREDREFSRCVDAHREREEDP